ncbi:hypothetical protein FJZ48_03845 [Candidatus Uhrbacteria bacterium]|nr:hypothetical protein [Candidatus Uhrbacteria bacterium]
MFILRILIGLVIAAVGVYMVIKTRVIEDFFGPVGWAESHLGSSTLFYKCLGIVIILIGFIVATNLWNAFLEATIGSIAGPRT